MRTRPPHQKPVFPDAPAGVLKRRRRALGCWLLLTLSGACSVVQGEATFAGPDPAEPPVVLPPWGVEETIDRRLLTAREDAFAALLGPTSLVAADTWSARSIATLAEALRRAPGVLLQESFGGFEPPRLSIRGSGLDSAPTARGVALLVDGLPLARADGSFHTGLFEPLLFSRVEIYRGTLHAALAPAVLGGALNAVSSPLEPRGGTSLRLEAGDFAATRSQLTHAWSRGRFAIASTRAGGWREHSGQQRAVTSATLRPTPLLEIEAYAAVANYDVPGPLTLTDALARPRSVSAATLRDLPRRRSNLVRASARVKNEHVAASGTTVTAGVSVQRLHDDFFQLQANGETDATSDDVAAHVTVTRAFSLGGLENHLLLRATSAAGVNRAERFLNDRGQRGARFGAFDARADNFAASLEDILWLRPTFALGAGVTATHATRDLVERPPSAGIARTFYLRDVTPRLGATWRASATTTFHAALSRGSEPPSFDDLFSVAGTFPNLALRSRELRAQRATTFETGARGSLGALGWTVTAYRAAWRDEILRLADASGQPRGAINAGPTVHEGIETALHWTIARAPHRVTLGVTSTLGRFRFDADPVYGDNRIAGAPPHAGSAEIGYAHARGFFTALETTWIAGRTSVDHAGRLTYGGHTLFNARAGWRWSERFTVVVTGRNLLDHAHLASTAGVLDLARAPATTAIFLPGAGRGFTLGLEWKR